MPRRSAGRGTAFDRLVAVRRTARTDLVEQLAAVLPPAIHCFLGVPATLFTQALDDEQILALGQFAAEYELQSCRDGGRGRAALISGA